MLIKEFLPNPIGQDADGEYIKLFNDGNLPVNLAGWSVKDASGKTFNLSGSLDGGKELLLPYLQTKVSLNNNGEQIFLYDNAGKLIDELSYSGQAEEGKIIYKRLATSELATSEIEYGQLNVGHNNWRRCFCVFFGGGNFGWNRVLFSSTIERRSIRLF